MMKQAKTNKPDELHEPATALETYPAVHSAVPATAPDGPAGTGAIAIFYGAAHYPFELARQRELVADYADATDLNLVTEFHDRQQRQHGLGMLLDACQRGGVEYVITASWPTPNLTAAEADAVIDQLAQAGTHLVCLNTWRPGDSTPPAWWNDEEGAWMRQLDELREQERQQREQASETGADNQVNQASRTGNSSQSTDPSKEVHHA